MSFRLQRDGAGAGAHAFGDAVEGIAARAIPLVRRHANGDERNGCVSRGALVLPEAWSRPHRVVPDAR